MDVGKVSLRAWRRAQCSCPIVRDGRPAAALLSMRPNGIGSSIPRGVGLVGLGPRIDRAERLADPRPLVFGRLGTTGPHEAVGVLVPGAVRQIVPDHPSPPLRPLPAAA